MGCASSKNADAGADAEKAGPRKPRKTPVTAFDAPGDVDASARSRKKASARDKNASAGPSSSASGPPVDDSAGTSSSSKSELASIIREVTSELDPDVRAALSDVLSRSSAPRKLSDEYEEVGDAKPLGKGAFSVVYLVRDKRTGSEYAAKVVPMKNYRSDKKRDQVRALLCEAGVAALAKHATVVGLRDVVFEESRIVVIQECCHGGSLLAIVQKHVDRKKAERKAAIKAAGNAGPGAKAAAEVAAGGGAMRERDAKIAVRRVAEALEHLHSKGYVHRDVKLKNLLLAKPGDLNSLKLADFGFATAVSGSKPVEKGSAFARKDDVGDRLRGTVEYAAPEVLADLGSSVGNGSIHSTSIGNVYGKKKNDDKDDPPKPVRSAASKALASKPAVDMWSAGVTVFLMLGGYHLFDASQDAYSNRLRMHVTLQKEYQKPAWQTVSNEAKSMIRKLLCSDAGERMTASQLLKDKWFSQQTRRTSLETDASPTRSSFGVDAARPKSARKADGGSMNRSSVASTTSGLSVDSNASGAGGGSLRTTHQNFGNVLRPASHSPRGALVPMSPRSPLYGKQPALAAPTPVSGAKPPRPPTEDEDEDPSNSELPPGGASPPPGGNGKGLGRRRRRFSTGEAEVYAKRMSMASVDETEHLPDSPPAPRRPPTPPTPALNMKYDSDEDDDDMDEWAFQQVGGKRNSRRRRSSASSAGSSEGKNGGSRRSSATEDGDAAGVSKTTPKKYVEKYGA